jgi:hypothetical protein
VVVDVAALVEVQRAGELLEVHHVGHLGPAREAQDAERSAGARVASEVNGTICTIT